MHVCELWNMIPEPELKRVMSHGCVELEPDFMCFENLYKAVADYVPTDYTIVDLGCYMAAQCYYFKNHKRYVGVDYYEKRMHSSGYVPPLRFETENTVHFQMSIDDYLDEHKTNDKTYYIMSAVPGIGSDMFDKHGIENYAWWYPGKHLVAHGCKAQEIAADGVAYFRRPDEIARDAIR